MKQWHVPGLAYQDSQANNTQVASLALGMAALGQLGHKAEHLAIYEDLDLLRQKIEGFEPDILFNLVEQFKNKSAFDQNIVSLLEMQGIPFTGFTTMGKRGCLSLAMRWPRAITTKPGTGI